MRGRKFSLPCPTCNVPCSVVNGPPYPHYACATHGAMIIARPDTVIKQAKLAAAEKAVKDAAMAWWRIHDDPDEPSSMEILARMSLRAACAALDRVEKG